MPEITEQEIQEWGDKKKLAMVVMSGDMDKLFGAFIIATGAAAMGMEVTMFFTFWGLRAIKKNVRTGKSLFGKMLGVMYGGDITKSNPSQFSFGGMGRWMFGKMMGANNVSKLIELRDLAVTLGVGLYPCQMSMDVMEIPRDTFIDGVQEPVGVGFFLMKAQEANSQLFI
ncbi:MAG: DsrE/DsrF/DrsH-like family protein [Actinomycetota bacterium]|nr:DsrE/DsrF/DrsH-like family protein [Actinomycetota bacterium]